MNRIPLLSVYCLLLPWISPVVSAKEWQVWIHIGQSLMNGPVGEASPLTSSDHDEAILEFVRGETNEGYQTLTDVMNSRGRVSPAEIFSRRMIEAHGEENVVIIRYSPGGYSITAFLDESKREVPKKDNNEDLWPGWVDLAREKMDFLTSNGDTVNLRGVVMFQGSADRASPFRNHYETHLRRLKHDARDRLGIPDLPWLQIRSPIGGINSGWTEGPVHQAQVSVSMEDENAIWISSDNPLGVENVFTDPTHPDLESTERIGVVAADAWAEFFSEREPAQSFGRWAIGLGKSSEVGDPKLLMQYSQTDQQIERNGYSISFNREDPALRVKVFRSSDLSNWLPADLEHVMTPFPILTSFVVLGPSSFAGTDLTPTGFAASGTHTSLETRNGDPFGLEAGDEVEFSFDIVGSNFFQYARLRYWDSIQWSEGNAVKDRVTTVSEGSNTVRIPANISQAALHVSFKFGDIMTPEDVKVSNFSIKVPTDSNVPFETGNTFFRTILEYGPPVEETSQP